MSVCRCRWLRCMSRAIEPEVEALPELGNHVLLEIVAQLPLRDVARSLSASHAWRLLLDGTDSFWSNLCHREWASRVYVPASLRALANGECAVDQMEVEERRRLMQLSTETVKDLMHSLRVGRCLGSVEKGEMVDAILNFRRKAVREGTETQKLLGEPSLLIRRTAGESAPKAALRLSFADAKRTKVTEDELTSFTFHVRIRHDGPIAGVIAYDPWWQGKGCGQANFQADGSLSFTWPPDPENHGATLDPFAAIGMHMLPGMMGWKVEVDGQIVRLVIHGQLGPQELVCRHPKTWGWVLYSQGTCWTSWPMPERKGTECSDPMLREEVLCRLPSQIERHF